MQIFLRHFAHAVQRRTGNGRRKATFSDSRMSVRPSGFWKSLASLASNLFGATPMVAVS